MPSELRLIEDSLNSELNKLTGSVFRISLKVSTNHERGHLTSDDLIRNAPAAKIDPLIVGKLLEKHFSQSSDYKIKSEQGFINVFFETVNVGLSQDSSILKPVSIYLPPVNSLGSISAAMRLMSAAVIQAKLCQKKAILSEFWLGELKIGSAENFKQLFDYIKNKTSFSSPVELPRTYLQFLHNQLLNDESIHVVWFSPECLPKNIYGKFYEDNFRCSINKIICPPKLYLNSLESADVNLFLSFEEQALYNAMLHLASPAQSEQLALSECSLPIKANIKWFISTLLGRIPALPDSVGIFNLSSFEESEKSLLVRSLLLNQMFIEAAQFGRVTDCLQIMAMLSDSFNFWFNRPDLRRRISEDSLSSQEAAIITVVRRAFSDILTLF